MQAKAVTFHGIALTERQIRRSVRKSCMQVVAEEGKAPGNPFTRRNTQKEDEAKKALQGLFQGKKDLLAAYDIKPDSGGRGGGSGRKKGLGGDGSNSDGWQPPNWRQWSIGLWNRLFRSVRALLAVLGFAGIILAIPLIPQFLGAILTIVKLTLRLEGRARSLPKEAAIDPFALAGTKTLGKNEISVIQKYGNDGS